jgi:hypothetical protein
VAPGPNANADCAATGGWGDAKGLDLWTYVTSPAANGQLWIDPLLRDTAASLFVPAAARPGTLVQGRLAFVYSLTLDRSCADTVVSFANLPTGASAACVDTLGQGRYVFSGFPATLAGGASVLGADPAAPMAFSYTAPAGGSVTAIALVAGASSDDVPANNSATGTTVISPVDLETTASAPLTALAGESVTVLASFSNMSGTAASPWTPNIAIGAALSCPFGVQLASAPPGVTMVGFDAATCAVSLSGLPPTLADGQILSLSFSYQAPALGQVPVTTTVATPGDVHTGNNSATATTTIAVVNMAISLSGMPLQAISGQPYFGTFSCTNAGLLDAVGGTRCAIDSGLPPGLSQTGCLLNGAAWVAGDTVPADATVICSVSGTPVTVGPMVMVASTAAAGDAILSDNTATQGLAVLPAQSIPTLSKSAALALAALLLLVAARLRYRQGKI